MNGLRSYSVQARYGSATMFVFNFMERDVADVVAKVAELIREAEASENLPPIGMSVGVPSLTIEIRGA